MATDAAPSPTASPSTKFGKFRRSRRAKDDNNVSSPSLASAATDEQVEGRTDARASTESFADKVAEKVSDKLRPNAKASGEDDRPSSDSSRRLSRLIPDKIKRRKGADADGDDRRPSLLTAASRQASSTSLNKTESVRSSLLTEDSEPDDAQSPGEPIRPSISPHDSHKGYLTVTAPQINAHADIQVDTSVSSGDNDPSSVASATPQTAVQKRRSDGNSTPSSARDRRSGTADKFKSALSFGKRKGSVDTGSSRSADTTGLIAPDSEDSADVPVINTPAKSKRASAAIQPEIVPTPPALVISSPKSPSRDASIPPATPPDDALPAPETLITPPTPTRVAAEKEASVPTKATSGRRRSKSSGFGNQSTLGSGDSSGPASAPALTPPAEEIRTPSGSLASPPVTNFFSSVLSAASTAATTWSNPFQNNPNSKGRQDNASKSQDKARLAGSERLPQGQLHNVTSLSRQQVEEPEPSPMTVPANGSSDRVTRSATADGQSTKAEEATVANAISAAYEKPVQSAIAQAQGVGRPRSIASQNSVSMTDQSPSRPPLELVADIKRSGSIRSRLSDRRRNRKRGSSVGTTNTFAPSLTQVNSVGHTPSIAPRTTGYAVANVKRNKDFHQLFRSVPEDDYLIEDYSAALQRDILLHGRFYVSEGHICFSSNILGWVTNLVIAFDEILSIEKKNTAIVFPNALVIETAHAKNTFASFVMRDSTFDLLIGIWKTAHPSLLVSPTRAALDRTSPPGAAQKGDSTGSDGSDDGSDDVYDEDAEDDDLVSMTENGANGSVAGSDITDAATVARKSSALAVGSTTPANGAVRADASDSAVAGTATTADYPGPSSHDPTECGDGATHYDRPLIDTTIPAPLGKIYSLYFGPQSGAFMKRWLVDDQKSRELSYEDDKTGLDESHKTFTYSYIKPLNAPVGPKQTKCIVTCNLQSFDLNSSISVDCSTQTPDVPSGNIFTTKTRYCLMWGPGNTTRMVANCTIEWTGKSWLKGPIEKGANDGQTQYVKDLVAALRAAVSKPTAKASTAKGKKTRRGTGKGEAEVVAVIAQPKEASEDWGLFDPLRPSLGPLIHFLRPFFTPQIVITVLFVLLIQSWFFNFTPRSRPSVGGVTMASSGAERMAAYEALWAREEAELWDWLEDRVGLSQGILAADGTASRGKAGKWAVDERMREREVDEALRITEEKLRVLKEARAP